MTDAKTKAATMFAGLKGRFDAACAKHAPDPIKTRILAQKVGAAALKVFDASKKLTDLAAKPTVFGVATAATTWAAQEVIAAAGAHADRATASWVYARIPIPICDLLLKPYVVPEVKGLYVIGDLRVYNAAAACRPASSAHAPETSEALWVEPEQMADLHKFVRDKLWETYNGCAVFEQGDLTKGERFIVQASPQADHIWARIAPFASAGQNRSVLLDGRPGTGKSTMARTLAARAGGRVLFVSLDGAENIFMMTGLDILRFIAPDAVVLDDFDRLGGSAINCLDGLERSGTRLLIVTTNNMNSLDPAIVRPGRFDELFTIDSLGAAYYRQVLGEAVWSALSAENQAKVETWPAAFLNELRLRHEHLPDCNINAEFAALASRVGQNARPTWATTTMTAVPTAPRYVPKQPLTHHL